MEIVSEPDIRTAEEASEYLKKLRSILRYIEVSDADMEKGNFRCDANVSIRPVGAKEFGTRAEIKNVNSFKFVQKAIEYEIKRQAQILDEGGRVVQETRLFDSTKGVTFSMRSKEEAHDYRYFPEPDLVPVKIVRRQRSRRSERPFPNFPMPNASGSRRNTVFPNTMPIC